jgi:hypothetical protein
MSGTQGAPDEHEAPPKADVPTPGHSATPVPPTAIPRGAAAAGAAGRRLCTMPNHAGRDVVVQVSLGTEVRSCAAVLLPPLPPSRVADDVIDPNTGDPYVSLGDPAFEALRLALVLGNSARFLSGQQPLPPPERKVTGSRSALDAPLLRWAEDIEHIRTGGHGGGGGGGGGDYADAVEAYRASGDQQRWSQQVQAHGWPVAASSSCARQQAERRQVGALIGSPCLGVCTHCDPIICAGGLSVAGGGAVGGRRPAAVRAPERRQAAAHRARRDRR